MQDRAIRLLRTAEQLNATGHYAGSESETKAYELLDSVAELTNNMDSRRHLLAMAVSFFRAAQSVSSKIFLQCLSLSPELKILLIVLRR